MNDRSEIERLLESADAAWAPGDPEDPTLRILRVKGLRGQYWKDAAEGPLHFVWEAGKALLVGADHDDEAAEGIKVELGRNAA